MLVEVSLWDKDSWVDPEIVNCNRQHELPKTHSELIDGLAIARSISLEVNKPTLLFIREGGGSRHSVACKLRSSFNTDRRTITVKVRLPTKVDSRFITHELKNALASLYNNKLAFVISSNLAYSVGAGVTSIRYRMINTQ